MDAIRPSAPQAQAPTGIPESAGPDSDPDLDPGPYPDRAKGAPATSH